MCELKVKKVSKVIPLIWTWGWRFDWYLRSGVKRVTGDLLGAIERPFEEAQSAMEVR